MEPQIHHLSVLFGPENGLFKLPKHYVLKGKWPILKPKNTVKQGKRRQKDKWYPFHACTGGGSSPLFHLGVSSLCVCLLCGFDCISGLVADTLFEEVFLPAAAGHATNTIIVPKSLRCWRWTARSGPSHRERPLGWHVCRTKFARNISFRATKIPTKNALKISRYFSAFILWVQKNSR